MTPATAAGWRVATCPRCGGSFECGVGADRSTPCWCGSYALGPERLAQLRARWSDCLCGECLSTLAANPQQAA